MYLLPHWLIAFIATQCSSRSNAHGFYLLDRHWKLPSPNGNTGFLINWPALRFVLHLAFPAAR